MSAILLRDLRSYAVTMTGWVFVAFILVFMGIFLVEQVSGNGYREGMRMLGDFSSRLYIIRRIED